MKRAMISRMVNWGPQADVQSHCNSVNEGTRNLDGSTPRWIQAMMNRTFTINPATTRPAFVENGSASVALQADSMVYLQPVFRARAKSAGTTLDVKINPGIHRDEQEMKFKCCMRPRAVVTAFQPVPKTLTAVRPQANNEEVLRDVHHMGYTYKLSGVMPDGSMRPLKLSGQDTSVRIHRGRTNRCIP